MEKFFKYIKKAIKKDRNNLSLYDILIKEAKNLRMQDDYIKFLKLKLKTMYTYSLATKLIFKQVGWTIK